MVSLFYCQTDFSIRAKVVSAGEHTVEVNVTRLPVGSYHYALEIDGRPVAHHNLLVQ